VFDRTSRKAAGRSLELTEDGEDDRKMERELRERAVQFRELFANNLEAIVVEETPFLFSIPNEEART